MLIKSVKNKDYGLLVDKVKINMEQGYVVSRLKNSIPENFYQNSSDKLWYYKNYKKDTRLIDVFYPDLKIKTVEFKNNDYNDYLPDNLIIKLDEKYENSFFDPPNCTIIEKGSSVQIKEGACAGEYRNMYWKVKDNENNTYYTMHIKDNIYTKISKRDINKVLTFNNNNDSKINFRPTWRLFQNGYVCCTINSGEKQKVYYLHQLIMDVHNENLTSFEKTVDHINQDKLDNRRTNLRLVNMSVQNANRDKQSRRKDACELPNGIHQTDIPKYVVYRKEFMDDEKTKYREYFYICNHPNCDKRWDTTKSSNVSIQEKLNQAKLKLQLIENKITQKEFDKKIGTTNDKIDFPTGIRLNTSNRPFKLVFDLRKNNTRYGYNYVLKTTNLQNELNTFIELINKKYPELKMLNYTINNVIQINDSDISQQQEENSLKLVLPPNFSFYFESKTKSYYFSFSKIEKGIRIGLNKKIKTNNIQSEFETFMKELNEKYEQIKPLKFTIENTKNINLYNLENNQDNTENQIQNKSNQNHNENIQTNNNNLPQKTINAPVISNGEFKLPKNISVVKTNQDYYLTFVKAIDGKRIKKMVKLTTNDFQTEYNNFIDLINSLYKDMVQFEKSTLQNIPYEYTSIVKPIKTEQVDNSNTTKPVMPANFSICNVNNVDYIQFCKKVDGQRYQYKTKINSYDLQTELNEFINDLNNKHGLNLDPAQNKIANTNQWKTTNKIIEHSGTPEKLAQRERTQRYLEKQKQSVGVDEFNKQKAQYAKTYRASKKAPAEIEV